jgi:hypothetical protein
MRECTGCHEDVHEGRLGPACADCHDPAGWRRVDERKFAHDRTEFPLLGRHAAVACAKCHVPGQRRRIAHARCDHCHADAHSGQLARRADGGRCESCHDVDGFTPARYGLEEHATTAYPITGAHLAVPCNGCHRPAAPASVTGAGPTRVRLDAAARPTARFRFASTRCLDCHADPHRGETDRIAGAEGCESCHKVESWRLVAFDHMLTRYPLTGAHGRTGCTGCHRKVDAGTPRERLRFASTPEACDSCHQDPHRGQFARAGTVACDRCHTTTDLKAAKFDHNRDSSYPLDGAHARVPCASCHPSEKRAGGAFVRYKPVPRGCSDCHGPVPPVAKQARS